MPFTLTLLGTDTTYSPGHVDNAYDKAETLSYISKMIQGDQLPTDSVTEFRNTNVAVVDGPTTLGPEVGDRIARGVQAILEAISRGEENISIIAHSRGAVEAILVAHEIERIQTLVANPPYDPANLTNSECKYTKAAMNGQHALNISGINLDRVAEHISRVKLSILNIDPVPGGNYMGITHASSLAWRDPRFYIVPNIVKEYEQYTYENERTRCFKSIVPKNASPDTLMKLNSLPGHHGTGSGNLLDQQRNPLPSGTAEHVQELVIVKIIDFLRKNGVALTPARQADDPFADIISRLFDGDEYSPDFKNQAQELSFQLYNNIIENREAYRHFNTTSYPTLGQEQALIRRIWNVVDQRIVHYHAHNDTYLESIVPPVPGGHFLNYEHARIHLNNELGLREGIPLSETINQSISRLVSLCNHKKALSELQENKTLPPMDINSSVIADKLVTAIETKEGFALLLDGLGMLIEEVKKPYLQGQFSDPQEREALYYAVQRAFREFKILAEDQGNEIAKTIFNTLNTNLEITLNTKLKSLEEEYEDLSIKLKSKEFFTVFQNKIQEISANLNNKSDGRNAIEFQLDLRLKATLNKAKLLDQSSLGLDSMRAFINSEQASYQDFYNSLEEQGISVLTNDSIELVNLVINEALDDSYDYDLENIMGKVINASNHLEQFRLSLPDLMAINNTFDYRRWEMELEEKRDRLVHLTAQYIVTESIDLQNKVKHLFENNELLYNQIEGLAIGLGAKNPLLPLLEAHILQSNQLVEIITNLEAQLSDLKQVDKRKDETAEEMRSRVTELETQLSDLKQESKTKDTRAVEMKTQIASLESRLSDLNKDNEKNEALLIELHAQINSLERGIQVEKNEKGVLSSNISSLSGEQVQLGKKKAELNATLSDLGLQNENKDKLVNELREGIKQLEDAVADDQIKIEERDVFVSQLIEKSKILGETIQDLERQLSRESHQIKKQAEHTFVLTLQNTIVANENEHLKYILNTDSELHCQFLIKTKLLPLTKEYLIHLASEIERTFEEDISINKDNIPEIINDVNAITRCPRDEPAKLLKQKFDKVTELYNDLVDQRIEKPSEKISGFYTKLNDANEVFKQHTDPFWKRFVTNTVAVIGIIITGILPGLLALAVISSATGRSPKFWQTRGEDFSEKSRNEIDEHLAKPGTNKGG